VNLTFGGTATLGTDYSSNSSQIIIPAGSTSGILTVTAIQDVLDEADETVIVSIDSVTNGTEDGDQQQTVTIVDYDFDNSYLLTVNYGTGGGLRIDGEVVTISANTPSIGMVFDKWTGDVANVADVNAADTTITMPAAATMITAVYTPDMDTAEQIACGSLIKVFADNINGMDPELTSRPCIYGAYTDPVKQKDCTGIAKTLFGVGKLMPCYEVNSEWIRSICLYNKKALKDANKGGTSTSVWLQNNPIAGLYFTLSAKAKTLDGTAVDSAFRNVQLVPPEITEVTRWDRGSIASGVHPKSILIVKGNFFGSKAPIVGLEYTSAKGMMKLIRLKVCKDLKYADAKGCAGKSCMDVETGESELRVAMSKKWWKDWTAGSYTLVLNNRTGVDTFTIPTEASDINTAPQPAADTVTLYPGTYWSRYYLDVLANDQDVDADPVKIKLTEKTSNQGGKLFVFAGKVRYTLPRAAVLPFTDSFSYSLDDGNEGVSGTATVNINIPAVTIDSLETLSGAALTSVQPGSVLVIKGQNFGIKAPTVTLAVENEKVIKLKVVSAPGYADYSNAAGKSYTDLTTGESQVTVAMPSREWAGYTAGTSYTLTVSNRFDSTGDNTTITTAAANTAPVANDDNEELVSGQSCYSIDVLANDTDAEADKLIIVLENKTSTLGGKISIDKTTNLVTYTRPPIADNTFAEFTDSFEYSLIDPSGETSGTATVNITVKQCP
jgi:Big-like domain-containing protein/List-Bact-rpt repeat protein